MRPNKMKLNNQYETLLKNTKILGIGNISIKFTQYLIVLLCTYKLTTSEYGIADTIIQISTMLVPIFSADISEALFRFSMDDGISSKSLFSNAIFVNFIGIILLICFTPVWMLIPKLGDRAYFITLLIIPQTVQLSVKEYVRGKGLTKLYTIGGICNSIIQIIGCLLFIYLMDLGIVGYFLSICCAYIVEIVVDVTKAKLFLIFSIHATESVKIRELLHYSIPLVPNQIMWWIVAASDRYFILWIIDAAATGLYAIAAKFPALITIITGFFFQAWQISAVSSKNENDKEIFYSKIFEMLWVIVAVITTLIIVMIKPLVYLLVSREYNNAWVYAPFLLVSAAFNSLQSFFGVNYTITKNSVGALKSTSIAAISNLVLNYYLINYLGIQGATIATMISYIIVTIYRYMDTRKIVKIKIINPYKLIVTYIILIAEATVLSINNDLYWITIIATIVIVYINHDSIAQFLTAVMKRSLNHNG
jgi:O-antigen/teichoic acid export membrane protein